MEAWEPLFDRALAALESLSPALPAPDWTMGGGTVLMFRYRHRLSHDVDIFLTDAQYLTALSPRLNDAVADLTERYREDSQHVKLIFPELGEVDFVVARDVFDLAVFLHKDLSRAKESLPILTARAEEISHRIEYYKKNPHMWEQEISLVQPFPGFDRYRKKSLDLVSRFYENPQKWIKTQSLEL